MKKDSGSRVALFARYSSKMQDELSLDAQVREMERYCVERGHSVVSHYLLPEISSYVLADHPTFQEMLRAGKRREYDILLLHKLDRLGRDLETSVHSKTLLRRAGVQVRSVVENLGDTVQDRLIENVLAATHDYYNLNLAQETRKGHAECVRQGLWRGGVAPFGYRVVKVPGASKEHSRLEPDPKTAPVMVEIYKRITQGARRADILDYAATATGQAWTHQTLYNRVKNPVYKGVVEFGKTRLERTRYRHKQDPDSVCLGECSPLVSVELWEEANARIAERAQTYAQRKRPKRTYLLTEGVASCATCGRPLVGSSSHGNARYVCSGAKNRLCEVRAGVSGEEFEAAIHRVFLEELKQFDLEGFIERYEASLQPEIDEAKRREARLRKDLTEVRKKIKNIVNAVAQGFAVDEMRIAMDELKADEKALADEIAMCQVIADRAVKENVALVRSYVSSMADLVPELTPEELKDFYYRNLRVEWDLSKQEGRLYLKLNPDTQREVGLYGRILANPCTPI